MARATLPATLPATPGHPGPLAPPPSSAGHPARP